MDAGGADRGSDVADEIDVAPEQRGPCRRALELAVVVAIALGGLLWMGVAASDGVPASWSLMGSTVMPVSGRDGAVPPAQAPSIADARFLTSATAAGGGWDVAFPDLPPSVLLWGADENIATRLGPTEVSDGPALTSSVQRIDGSDDARVAYGSVADDLPGADDDDGCAPHGGRCADVFLFDEGLDATFLVSDGVGTGTSDNHTPALAATDRVVAFTSEGPGLVADDADDAADVYVAEVGDLGDVALERVSVATDGTETVEPATSTGKAISADGRYLVFTTTASLDPVDGNGTSDVYLRDRVAGTTRVVSARHDGFAAGDSAEGAISADGSVIAFTSGAPDVAWGAPGLGHRQVYAYDVADGETWLVSQVPGGPAGLADSSEPAVSTDGAKVAFTTEAANVVASADGPVTPVVAPVHEVVVAHVDVDLPGAGLAPRGAAVEVLAPTRLRGVDGAVWSEAADLSLDTAVFLTDVAMDPEDTNGVADVYWLLITEPWCDTTLLPREGPGQFCAEISWTMGEGLMGLYDPAAGFEPLLPVTRQAMAAITYRRAGSPLGDDPQCIVQPFPDVPTGASFCGEIAWMADEGLTTGYPDGTFRPTAPVSRQAMLAFLWRQLGEPDSPACPPAPFPDVPTGHAFCEAIGWGVDAGITAGYADGTFHTTAPLSRQAAAAFLFRTALYLGDA